MASALSPNDAPARPVHEHDDVVVDPRVVSQNSEQGLVRGPGLVRDDVEEVGLGPGVLRERGVGHVGVREAREEDLGGDGVESAADVVVVEKVGRGGALEGGDAEASAVGEGL